MRYLFKNLLIASFFVMVCVVFFSCGKGPEKTTTIIKENDIPNQKPEINFKIKAGETGISVETK